MEIHFNTTFFKALCEHCDTTIPKVATETGNNPQTFRRFVNGESMPSIETLAKLGLYFDVDFSLFIVIGEPLEVLTYEEQEAIKHSTRTAGKDSYRKWLWKLNKAKADYEALEKDIKQKKGGQLVLKSFLLGEKKRLQNSEMLYKYLEAKDSELYDFIMSIEE